MSPGKVWLAVIGGLVGLLAAGFLATGAGMLWSYQTQRAVDGYFTSPATELSTESYALTSDEVDLGAHPGDWFPSGPVATVRIEAEAAGNVPVFVGIGPKTAVDSFLAGVAVDEVTWLGPDRVSYRSIVGTAPPSAPTERSFWVASSAGSGLQALTWDLERGEWKMVVMNPDAMPGVIVDVAVGAKTDLLLPVSYGLLFGGLLAAGIAAGLLVLAFRRPLMTPAGTATTLGAGRFSRYPVHLEGMLDPGVSRWQWLFKWLLVVPHLVVLAFLWAAFGVLTLVAGVAILFTGRYPKSIFNFNVGVIRWTWRVAFYSYSALGTDQYPPFTLAEADYPATFDIEYPERLSRGLVLVKWWLLAIPHYLIVGLLTSGLVWWSTQIGESGNAMLQIGGGLIGLLVLIAAIALVLTGRYPQGLFDVVVGLNRWVYRVWAYAGLMRDEYPPFRLDSGGDEPGAKPSPTPDRPMQGGDFPTRPGLIDA